MRKVKHVVAPGHGFVGARVYRKRNGFKRNGFWTYDLVWPDGHVERAVGENISRREATENAEAFAREATAALWHDWASEECLANVFLEQDIAA